MGLMVHPVHQYLRTSLDGHLPDGTPVEIKTVHNILSRNTIRDTATIN